MNILLLGEFSGLHKNLKDGLELLGHDVTIAGTGDGFKKLEVDLSFDATLPSLFGKVESYLKPHLERKQLSGFDVVQVMNPFLFYRHRLPKWINGIYHKLLFSFLKANNGSMFLLAAGSDGYFWRNTPAHMRYSPHCDEVKYDLNGRGHPLATQSAFQFNQDFIEWFEGVIPTMFEYEVAYAGEDKLLEAIPMPINTDKIPANMVGGGKNVNVFHGLNRYGFKGTRHVEGAFDIISNIRDDVSAIIKGRLPLTEYLALMERMDIVIDQTNSYSLGMNGLFAMAMGKVVLGGSEPESLACLDVTDSPVVNVLPDKNDIVEKLVGILDDKNGLEERSFASRKFVERVHDCRKVAQNFLHVWKNPEQHKNQHKILATSGYLDAA